jgi:hypothetical protein
VTLQKKQYDNVLKYLHLRGFKSVDVKNNPTQYILKQAWMTPIVYF